MPSVNFQLFKVLWERAKDKFAIESEETFTLENLNSRGVKLKRNDWNKINEKLEMDEVPEDINLSPSAYKVLYEYIGIGNLTDLGAVSEEIERRKNEPDIVPLGFLGRKDELNKLNGFLVAPERRILELYGVPMIGKTELINHFLDDHQTDKSYTRIIVKLNPQPEDAELKLKQVIFGNRAFNDLSGFSSNTLIVIQNFEEALRWTGDPEELHDIHDRYSNIKAFLNAAVNVGTIKLIIESRFKIHFRSLLLPLTPWPVESLGIGGVERKEFWRFYRSKGFSHESFEKLCSNFNDHTGLLALAYNDDFIYEERLIDAIDRPKETTIYLWKTIEGIVKRLRDHEILSLCAITLLKEPTAVENLYRYLISPEVFNDELEIDDSLRSLEKKLLVQAKGKFYALNPYIREVCFTFLTKTHRREMQFVSNLPYFKTHGEKPIYNPIRQAQDSGNYMYLFDLGRAARRAGRYDEAFEALEAGLRINPDPKYVLNEQAICYRETDQIDKAIEVWNRLINEFKHLPAFRQLADYYRENNRMKEAIGFLERARKINPKDKITLTELAISYQNNEEYEKSIKAATEAINLGDNYCYIILANTYQTMGDIEKAYQTARKGVEVTRRNDPPLIEKLQELEDLRSQPPEAASKSKSLKIFISYSRRDEEIKERIDAFLATLKREGKIETWNDRRIPAGDGWDKTIRTELELADVILLLISQDFIQSEYIWKTELPRALERHKRKEAIVIPIFCHATDDIRKMPFAELKGLPKDAVPINSPDNNSALSEVARGIREIVETLLEERNH